MSKYYTSGATVTPSSFMAFPKQLFNFNISLDAKVLYSILLDRVSLSIKNNLVDVAGRVYIIFKQENIMQLLGCANKKAQKLFKELENCDLIERKKRGNNLPDLIFVKQISDESDAPEPEQADNENCEVINNINRKPVDNMCKTTHSFRVSKAAGDFGRNRDVKRTAPGQVKMTSINKTENNYTELSETKSIYLEQTVQQAKDIDVVSNNERLMDYSSAQNKVKSQIDYDALCLNTPEPNNRFILDSVVKVISDVFSRNSSISINHYSTGYAELREKFSKLNMFHIEYVMECITNREGLQPIKNLKSYLATALFNAPDTIDWHYDQKIKSKGYKRKSSGVTQKFKPEGRDLSYLVI